ncbi:MAG: MerR family transcriptional regulator [Candidatus Eiseniibacteriota bacterium]
MPKKTAAEPGGEKLYRSISEVSELLDVKPHVLRYWETQFSMLRPRKNRAGNRMYRPEEVKLLYTIKDLLYGRRYTIAGAKKSLSGEKKTPSGQLEIGYRDAEKKVLLEEVRSELARIAEQLRQPPPKRRVLKT